MRRLIGEKSFDFHVLYLSWGARVKSKKKLKKSAPLSCACFITGSRKGWKFLSRWAFKVSLIAVTSVYGLNEILTRKDNYKPINQKIKGHAALIHR